MRKGRDRLGVVGGVEEVRGGGARVEARRHQVVGLLVVVGPQQAGGAAEVPAGHVERAHALPEAAVHDEPVAAAHHHAVPGPLHRRLRTDLAMGQDDNASPLNI